MKLISVAVTPEHIFLIYAPSITALRKSLTKHGPALAEQLVGGEESVKDRFFRMKQAVLITETARKAE
jgi:hypothetical protein